MSVVRMLLVIAPLRLTLWVLIGAGAVIVLLVSIGVARHVACVRRDRRRERVHGELEPVFSRFFQTEDRVRLAEELRPAFMRMDAAERPVAAVLVAEEMQAAPWSRKEPLRMALEQSGIVELGHKGTRRFSPWRRALACEMLGKIGSPRSVPVLLERLSDRRPVPRQGPGATDRLESRRGSVVPSSARLVASEGNRSRAGRPPSRVGRDPAR